MGIAETDRTTSERLVTELQQLVMASPTSYHAAQYVAQQFEGAGFTRLEETETWPQGAGNYVLVRDGAVIAWRIPEQATPHTPVAILGAHTDSPGFRIKPTPQTARSGWQTLNVEVYGGPLLNSWLDRDLRIGARCILCDGRQVLAATEPVARIPQLAIHLERGANDGLTLDKQQHTRPVIGLDVDGGANTLRELLAADAGVAADEIVAMDAFVADGQMPAQLGASGELVASGRLDNLASVLAGTRALLAVANPDGVIPVFAAFDHEEVGSETRSGAGGPMLRDVLQRIGWMLGASDEDRVRAHAASWCVSSDVGHSIHPNYANHHDDDTQPVAGGGPILKINANQRYTTDAAGEALWRRCSATAGVPVQAFVSRNTIPCGSTIGPITATRLGIRTVDVGIPILSMHSARELAAVRDLDHLDRVIRAFFARPASDSPAICR